MAEEMQPLEIIDWHEVSERAELKKPEKQDVPDGFAGLLGMIQKSRVALVEVDRGGALAAYKYFFGNIARGGEYVVPILGATTPYDIMEHGDRFGAKSCAWVTSANVEDPAINEKFNMIKPSNLFEITSFIKTIGTKTEEQIFFVSDMFDEIYNLISEKEFHTLLSRIHALLKGSKNSLVMVVQTSLYSKDYLAMLERYSDIKISYGETIRVVDLKTNEETEIK